MNNDIKCHKLHVKSKYFSFQTYCDKSGRVATFIKTNSQLCLKKVPKSTVFFLNYKKIVS